MKREWTDDMGEISGFGGGYEAACRAMVLAGMDWLDAHPSADPQFHGYKGIYGVIASDNEDAKALSEAVIAGCPDGGATGAMHQAAIGNILYARKHGWDAFVAERRKADAQEKAK